MALFTSLVETSLSNLTDAPSNRPVVVIIDALDECGGLEGPSSSDRKTLQQALKRWPRLPEHLKLVVTSRGEGDITRILSDISTPIDIPSGNSVTDNPQAQASIDVSEDVRTFLEERFREIRASLTLLPPNWPGEDAVDNMVLRAAGNFMWATTTAKFIESDLSASGDRTVRMWDLSSRGVGPVTHANKSHANRVSCVVFSPCGKMLGSLGGDNTIRVWDVRTDKCLLDRINSLSDYMKIIFSPDGNQTVRAWNVDTAKPTFDHNLGDDNFKNTRITDESINGWLRVPTMVLCVSGAWRIEL
jgi:WD40 repeat protein